MKSLNSGRWGFRKAANSFKTFKTSFPLTISIVFCHARFFRLALKLSRQHHYISVQYTITFSAHANIVSKWEISTREKNSSYGLILFAIRSSCSLSKWISPVRFDFSSSWDCLFTKCCIAIIPPFRWRFLCVDCSMKWNCTADREKSFVHLQKYAGGGCTVMFSLIFASTEL